jgi:hypothetical protein
MSPIPEGLNFGPAENYLDMMQNLRRGILATPDQHDPGNVRIGHAGPACDEIKSI